MNCKDCEAYLHPNEVHGHQDCLEYLKEQIRILEEENESLDDDVARLKSKIDDLKYGDD